MIAKQQAPLKGLGTGICHGFVPRIQIAQRAHLSRFICALAFLIFAARAYSQGPEFRIGIVTDEADVNKDFSAFTSYLDEQLDREWPGIHFHMVAAPTTKQLVRMLASGEVQFAIGNPVSTVQLTYPGGARPIATVVHMVNGIGVPGTFVPWMAGVAFVRSGDQRIRTLADARHKRIAGLDRLALGGWLSLVYEWRALGIHEKRDFASVEFPNNYWKLAAAVCTGKADVGVLSEAAFQEIANTCPAGFRILPPRGPRDPRLPAQISSRLYPESAFTARMGVDEKIVAQLVVALLGIQPGSAAARAAHIGGFTIPLNYESVAQLMRELHVSPFENYGHLTATEAMRQHWLEVVAVLSLFLLILAVALVRTRKLYGKLSVAEAFRRRVFESSPLPVLILDAATGEIVDCNPEAQRAYGFESGEALLGRKLADISAPVQFKAQKPAILADSYLDRARAGADTRFEWRYIKPDGAEWEAEVRVMRFTAGDRKLLQLTARDITESRRLAERVRLLAQALHGASDAIWICDERARIMYVNESFVKAYGYAEKEVNGRTFDMLIAGRTGGDARRDILKCAEDGWRGEIWSRAKDGREFPCLVSASPVFDDNRQAIATVLCARDMTEIRALQEQYLQSQKMEAVGQLAGGIAHDFNNLLTVINGYSEMLATSGGDDAMAAAEIQKAGMQAADLTKQLLAFGRREVIRPIAVNLNRLVEESESMFRRLLGEDCALRTRLAPDAGHVTADPGQLHQILMNLLVNSRQAMPHGGQVTIATGSVELKDPAAHGEPELKPGQYVRLSVSDTGTGMDENVRRRIFEPFFSTKGERGSGLGLATVYAIVKQSQGAISVSSQPGHGAVFEILLPQTAEKAAAPDKRVHALPAVSGRRTVLVLEDQEEVRFYARRVLERGGYNVLDCACGEDALQIAREHAGPIHLLLSDVILGGMNGPEVWSHFRPVRPECRLLFASGYSADLISERGILMHGVDLIQKPYTPDQLLRAVTNSLSGEASVTAARAEIGQDLPAA